MRSMFRSMILALVAALALSAAAAASASATEWEWLLNGTPVTESTAVTLSESTVELNDLNAPSANGNGQSLTCSGSVSGKGTVAPKGAGTITELKLTKCTLVHQGECKKESKEAEESKEWVKALHLPWKTQLDKSSGIGLWKTTTGGTGSPGFRWECETLIGKYVDECTVSELLSEPKNEAWGVLMKFNWERGPVMFCTQGGKGGLYGGSMKLKGPAGKILHTN